MSPKQQRMMIFLSFDRAAATALRADGRTEDRLVGYSATARLISTHGYRAEEQEDADYAAQLYASIAGMMHGADDRRLVLAADVPAATVSDHRDGAGYGDDDGDDADYGAVGVHGLDWADVTAVFVDEHQAGEAVSAARKAIADTGDPGLATVLELPAVAALTDNHELLWHTPDEDW